MLKVIFLESGQVLDHISRRMNARGQTCKIAIAYMKSNGLARLKYGLTHASGTFVVGTSSFHITDWQALNHLMRIADSNPKLQLRSYYQEKFHPKVFYFKRGTKAAAIVGSSNLTGGGP